MKQLLVLCCGVLFLIQCAPSTPKPTQVVAVQHEVVPLPQSDPREEILSTYQTLQTTPFPDSVPLVEWNYDADSNNLTFSTQENKAAALMAYNHRLYLAFDGPLVKENPRTLRLHAQSPFGSIPKAGAYKKVFRVNGQLYSGVLIGVDQNDGTTILKVAFYEGIRVGSFEVKSDLGRWHQHNFNEDMPTLAVPDVVRKPVLYLYPEQPTRIQVQLQFKGEVVHSYPHYPQQGWQVLAQPDGTLLDEQSGKTYPYLFWEGRSGYRYELKEGFVVEGSGSADFLDQTLAHLGLNRKEATDFITYWLPGLERSPYNLIHFSTEAYATQAPLHIQPAPETLIRVFMVYQPLAAPIDWPQQQLPKARRQGYTVVEWGGKKAQSGFSLPQ